SFRWVLKELFLWRLRREKMRVVMLTLDTMVMDNDEALQREGCDPTYKKVKGFQPLQLIWEGKIVDAIFRRGKRHSNYGHDVEKKKWKEYANERQVWSYVWFSYQCESWKKAYRALYTRPQYEDQQRLLEFARPDNIILTNLVSGEPVLERMPRAVREYWEEDS